MRGRKCLAKQLSPAHSVDVSGVGRNVSSCFAISKVVLPGGRLLRLDSFLSSGFVLLTVLLGRLNPLVLIPGFGSEDLLRIVNFGPINIIIILGLWICFRLLLIFCGFWVKDFRFFLIPVVAFGIGFFCFNPSCKLFVLCEEQLGTVSCTILGLFLRLFEFADAFPFPSWGEERVIVRTRKNLSCSFNGSVLVLDSFGFF